MSKSEEQRGQSSTDFFKNVSRDFLEREKIHLLLERIPGDYDTKTLQNEVHYEENNKEVDANESRTKVTQNEDGFIVSSESTKEGSYAPQRYTTTCYFQPKQNPVKYSETVVVKIGSTKKSYYECVYYQTKMVPNRWIENMTTLTPTAIQKSEISIPLQEEYHYISLENQQPKLVEAVN